MKIDIITLHNVKNYGSVLQTLATQYEFEKMGLDVEFINYYRNNTLNAQLLNLSLKNSKVWNKNIMTRILYKIVKLPSIKKKCNVFDSFLKNNIKLTNKRYLTLQELKQYLPEADIYCTGSDQVWNSDWNDGIEKPFFLDFVPNNKKCISYSSSIGKDKLDESEKKIMWKLLKKYTFISVREDSAVKILNDIGIKNAIQILDPTLVLNKCQWKEFIKYKYITKKYILIYQLNPNKRFDIYCKEFARKRNLKLIRISYQYDDIFKSGKLICLPNVEKFLSLFYYSEYVITDSFHGVAFSINFNKKFLTIYPEKFSTRIQSLLELTNLKNRVLKSYNDFRILDAKIDYDNVNFILEQERKKVDKYLKKVLN